MAYYIKTVWPPGGQEEGLRDDKETEFAEGQKQIAERFIKCDGFFLYETGHKNKGKIGAKAIFARGTVQAPFEVKTIQDKQGHKVERGEEKKFPYHVRINLSKNERVNSRDGVSLNTIRKVLKKPKERMQRKGGIIKIKKDQFNKLYSELKKCSQKAKNKKS